MNKGNEKKKQFDKNSWLSLYKPFIVLQEEEEWKLKLKIKPNNNT